MHVCKKRQDNCDFKRSFKEMSILLVEQALKYEIKFNVNHELDIRASIDVYGTVLPNQSRVSCM